jgi:hypothetical protein
LSAVLLLGWFELALIAALAAAFVLSSLVEGERRAAGIALGICAPLAALLALLLVLETDALARQWVVLSGLVLGGALLLACTLPFGARPALRVVGEQERVDERDAVFHRFYRLAPGTSEYESYYQQHPEKLELDQQIRALPPLCGPGSRTYHPETSPLTRAAFDLTEQLARGLDEMAPLPRKEAPLDLSVAKASQRIKGFARHLGADLVGCTRLNPAYIYSHVGRGEGPWGAPISLPGHDHAVAIAVEMRHELLRQAPRGPTTLETAVRYLDAAKIALTVARYINLLGYRARAHVDSNYRVLCIPVAVDAGLGELGRLGLLITPRFGPRVRLAVVTTDLPLAQDEPVTFGVQHFCAICKKCAINCPSGSIDAGDKGVHRGVEKWLSQQDSCYHTWRRCGSDCAICVKVCPYSHPNGPVHDLIRRVIRRNPAARRLALWGDDLAYGRRPKRRYPLAPWIEEGDE